MNTKKTITTRTASERVQDAQNAADAADAAAVNAKKTANAACDVKRATIRAWDNAISTHGADTTGLSERAHAAHKDSSRANAAHARAAKAAKRANETVEAERWLAARLVKQTNS